MGCNTGRMIIILLVGVFFSGHVFGEEGQWLSPVGVVADSDGGRLFIAYGNAKQVGVFDVSESRVTDTIDIPDVPTGIVCNGNGDGLYVTCGDVQGSVYVFDTGSKKVVFIANAGHGACCPVASSDGKRLYICNRFDNSVGVIDLAERKVVAEVKVLREPVAADISADGKWLFVGNHLPDGPATADIVASKVSVINTESLECEKTISLPNGSTGLNGVTVSPDGRYVFVSHVLGRYTVPTTQLERGWMNTNALSIIDAKKQELFETVLLDDVDRGAANPWAVECTQDGKYVCLTTAGTDELHVIDVAAMTKKIAERHAKSKSQGNTGYSGGVYGSGTGSEIPNELSFLYEIRQRVKLLGKGARSMALIGSRVFVAEYFTDSISVVDISQGPRIRPKAIKLGKGEAMTVQRRGEMLFNDASLCFQQWQSCASCHPGNARADALNWDLLNDGLGNPKNTKSLLLSHQTPPSMMTGVRADAEAAVRAGIKHIQFAVRPEEEAVAIDEYLKSLEPVVSPYLVKGKLSESAVRGREVFDKAGCASCHSGLLHTNLKKYNVGTGEGLDADKEFDTPSLVEIWRTAPYLYDGRAATVEEVLRKYNPEDKHGKTTDLTEQEILDLAEFVLSQ